MALEKNNDGTVNRNRMHRVFFMPSEYDVIRQRAIEGGYFTRYAGKSEKQIIERFLLDRCEVGEGARRGE